MAENIGTIDYRSPLSAPQRDRHPYWAAGLIGFAAAMLFAGYELVRSPANTLFKEAYGKEALPYVMAATPLAVIAALYLYGRLLTWLGARRTLLVTTLGSAAALAGCFLAVQGGSRLATAVLYLIRETYVVLLVEQYWSFLNSTLSDRQGRRLNGPICGIGSGGSILGGFLVGLLATQVGTASLLLIAVAFTVPAAILSDLAYRQCGEPRPRATERGSDTLGVTLFARSSLLGVLLLVILLTQAVSGLSDLAFQGILEDQIPQRDPQTAFSGWFFMWLNIASAGMQFIATPLLLRVAPVALVHVLIPLVHVGTCLYLFGNPTLFSAGAAYMVFKTLDYSLFRAAKELLYIPLSFDVRYRAKELIDVFGYRLGKGGMSLAVIGMRHAQLIFSDPHYGLAAAVAAGVWTMLAIPLGRAYRQSRQTIPAEPVPASSAHSG